MKGQPLRNQPYRVTSAARPVIVEPLQGRSGDTDFERRLGARFSLTFSTQCRLDDGTLSDVWLVDLSREGCQLFTQPGKFVHGQSVIVMNLGDAAQVGRVTWTADMKIGIEFEEAIHARVFARILAYRSPAGSDQPETEPMHDQFGRRLAPLPRLDRLYRDRR